MRPHRQPQLYSAGEVCCISDFQSTASRDQRLKRFRKVVVAGTGDNRRAHLGRFERVMPADLKQRPAQKDQRIERIPCAGLPQGVSQIDLRVGFDLFPEAAAGLAQTGLYDQAHNIVAAFRVTRDQQQHQVGKCCSSAL